MSELLKAVRLNVREKDFNRVQYLKETLNAPDEASAVRESIKVAEELIKVIDEGGDVIIKPKHGRSERLQIIGKS